MLVSELRVHRTTEPYLGNDRVEYKFSLISCFHFKNIFLRKFNWSFHEGRLVKANIEENFSLNDSLLFPVSEFEKYLTVQPSYKPMFFQNKIKIRWVVVNIGLVSIDLMFMVILG